MTHLAARPLVARSALRADRGNRTAIGRMFCPGPSPFTSLAATQNFLENTRSAFHYPVMGEGGVARPARNRPPTVDSESRNILDIHIALSMCHFAMDKLGYRNVTMAWIRTGHAYGRNLTVYTGPIEHAMIGNPSIANAQHHRFGENIHAKCRKSAAIAPILHECVPESCARHGRLTHDGGWVDLRDSGATPNERSGR